METSSSTDIAPEPSDDEESSEDEDFQTVPLDDEHWTTEIIPERTFCYMKMGYPVTCAHTHVHMELMTHPRT